MHQHFDSIVVGAGIVGSATTYNLSKNRNKTLLLEQFELLHVHGSSHGASRVTRMSNSKTKYMQMMPEAHRLWRELEIESKTSLLRKTGLLWMGTESSGEIDKICKDLKSLELVHERLSAKQVRSKYPQLQFDDSWSGFFDPEGAILNATECLTAFQNCFLNLGGLIHDRETVTGIFPTMSEVKLETSKATYTANNLVLCAGPWTNNLLELVSHSGPRLPLKPQFAPVPYWKASPNYSSDADFPCFMFDDGCEGKFVYGLPSYERPGLIKFVACGESDAKVDPDQSDNAKEEQLLQKCINETRAFLSKHFSSVQTNQPAIVERCLITVTPDMDFVMDRHPNYPNIVIGAGFSGQGFKLSPVIGMILAKIAANDPVHFDLRPYRFDRFSAKANF